MSGYREDRAWSDRFIPQIKRIVGPYLLNISSDEVDCTQAADLVVLRAEGVTIACRVRRAGYWGSYPWQFTMRSHRRSGAQTEFRKIIDGWGDWFFYGHESASLPGVVETWFLIDLHAWRSHMIRHRKRLKWGERENTDGQTSFAWFDLRHFPADPPILIASSVPVPPAADSESAGSRLVARAS